MKHILKRMISLSMVVIIAIGALAGCSGKDTAAKAETEAAAAETGTAAMGRYLEEEMGIYDSSDLGFTWNKVMDIPTELYDAEKQTFLERVVLMPDGSLACKVPATELKAYTLEDNPEIRQVIALFQKKYPDIRVTLEIGISGDNSVTVSDALKTLNTNMIAGNGPDLLIMDGISVDSYIGKGRGFKLWHW